MKIDRVTITGADDSIKPDDILSLSNEFPFVEWGILVSESSTGRARFPSHDWVSQLQLLCSESGIGDLSLHICGKWVRDLLIGKRTIPSSLFDYFPRVQLNFHAEKTACDAPAFRGALIGLPFKQFIFQLDGAHGNHHLETAAVAGILDCVGLFDVSGGAGIVPGEWPAPMYMTDDSTYAYHGYAGGLGPDSLETELPRIAEAAGDCRIWIDMETRVRSEDDAQFDLAKVRRCLEICQPWINAEVPV